MLSAHASADAGELRARAVEELRRGAAAAARAGEGERAFAAAEIAKARLLADSLKAPSAAELRALLPAGALYVSLLAEGDAFMAVVISARGGTLRRPLRVPGLAASIAAWRYMLAIPPEWRGRIEGLPKVWRRADGSYGIGASPPEPGAAQVEDADELAAWLGAVLLEPLAGELAAARRLIVSPDGALAFLPFEALRLGDRYLVERLEVHYTGAAALYALSQRRALEYAKLERPAGMLAVGGAAYQTFVRVTPVLNLHYELLDGMPPPADAAGTAGVRSSGVARAFKARRVAWGNLPGTANEAQRVAALFPQASVLQGTDASEARLWELSESGALERFRHLFFATHGYLSPDEPGLSSVVLSLVGNEDGHDGYVTAAEWPRYRLKSDLVMIAASNSGFGGVRGAAGLLALPYALHVAGNRNAVLSLWTLNEPPSAELVARFFARVRAGEDHVAALAAAKREAIDAGRRPHHWAQFILHGS